MVCRIAFTSVLLLAVATPGGATTVTIGGTAVANEGMMSSVPGNTTVTFDSLSPGGPVSYISGIATFSNLVINQGSTADIVNDTSPYADPSTSVGNLQITFSQPVDYFGLYWGSPDATNTIVFFDGAAQVFSLTGAQLSSAYGVGLGDGNAAFVNFTAGAGEVYTRVVISPAGGSPFENDNDAFSAATPEPNPGLLAATGAAVFLTVRARYRSA